MDEYTNDRKTIIHLLSRREILLIAGGVSLATLFGRSIGQTVSREMDEIVGCVVSPEQTAGPYFVDERLNRRDIRSDPLDKSVKTGVLLDLELSVFQVNEKNCTPLKNVMVDIWHCDAAGLYSDVDDFDADTRGQKFLRGFQVTDKDGKVNFRTIYPGWYSGRTVHIHYKIRANPSSADGFEHTSQLYFDDSITKEIGKSEPYSKRNQKNITNQRDGIFRDGGDKLMLDLAKNKKGYTGKYSIGFHKF